MIFSLFLMKLKANCLLNKQVRTQGICFMRTWPKLSSVILLFVQSARKTISLKPTPPQYRVLVVSRYSVGVALNWTIFDIPWAQLQTCTPLRVTKFHCSLWSQRTITQSCRCSAMGVLSSIVLYNQVGYAMCCIDILLKYLIRVSIQFLGSK